MHNLQALRQMKLASLASHSLDLIDKALVVIFFHRSITSPIPSITDIYLPVCEGLSSGHLRSRDTGDISLGNVRLRRGH